MLTIILAITAGLLFGHLAHRLGSKYQIVKRTRVDMLSFDQQLNLIRQQLTSIWAMLQANGYQTAAYTGYVPDYSGYSFTGYAGTTISTGMPEDVVGPFGATGPQGDRITLGGAVVNNTPPPELLPAPEVDHLEEPRYS